MRICCCEKLSRIQKKTTMANNKVDDNIKDNGENVYRENVLLINRRFVPRQQRICVSGCEFVLLCFGAIHFQWKLWRRYSRSRKKKKKQKKKKVRRENKHFSSLCALNRLTPKINCRKIDKHVEHRVRVTRHSNAHKIYSGRKRHREITATTSIIVKL